MTDVNEHLIGHLKGRAIEGKDKYGVPLLAFNGRNPLKDKREELLDALVYNEQDILEREAVADLLERASSRIDPHFGHTPEDVNGHPHPNVCATCAEYLFGEDGEDQWAHEQVEYWRSMDPMAVELRDMAQKLRQDIKRIGPEDIVLGEDVTDQFVKRTWTEEEISARLKEALRSELSVEE